MSQKISHNIIPEKRAGAITLEACIALPFFLCFFFLLLYLTRIACIMITLDQAASQTAKHLAAASYPLSFINEYIDDKFEGEGFTINIYKGSLKKVTDVIAKKNDNTIAGIIFGGVKDSLIDSIFTKMQNVEPNGFVESIDGFIEKTMLKEYEALTNKVKYELVGDVLSNYLDSRLINPEQLNICLLELPKGEAESSRRRNDPIYEDFAINPEKDFSREDVVVQLEYELLIPIPFYRDRTIKLRSTAVERAWTAGGNGIYTKQKEGLDFEKWKKLQFTVYKARTGKKYHISPDCFYLGKSCIPLSKEEAREEGLTLHANCPRGF